MEAQRRASDQFRETTVEIQSKVVFGSRRRARDRASRFLRSGLTAADRCRWQIAAYAAQRLLGGKRLPCPTPITGSDGSGAASELSRSLRIFGPRYSNSRSGATVRR